MSNHDASNNKSIFKIAMNLTLACIFSGTLLALTFYITAPVIAKQDELIKTQTMKELIKEADSFKPTSSDKEIFIAKKGSKDLGYIVSGESKGFSGTIKTLVAISNDLKIINFQIISHHETPGLGDKAEAIQFRSQFFKKGLEHLKIVKDASNKEDIQAITGATITSKAVNESVKTALSRLTLYLKSK